MRIQATSHPEARKFEHNLARSTVDGHNFREYKFQEEVP